LDWILAAAKILSFVATLTGWRQNSSTDLTTESPMKKTLSLSLAAAMVCTTLLSSGCGNGAGNAGTTTAAQTVAKTLAAPDNVIATSFINKVTLAWSPVAGASSYNVYWSVNPGVTTATGTKVNVTGTEFEHVGLTVSRVYFYVVTAVDASGESIASTLASTVPGSDGDNLYATYCQGCHGLVTASTIMAGTTDNITAAIAKNTGGMGSLSTLTAAQISIISEQLPCH
jgi:hypothetical protein